MTYRQQRRQSEREKDMLAQGRSPWAPPEEQPYRTKLDPFDQARWQDGIANMRVGM